MDSPKKAYKVPRRQRDSNSYHPTKISEEKKCRPNLGPNNYPFNSYHTKKIFYALM